MEIEDFTSKLEEYGYDYRESRRSLTISYCPECGRNKYKVLFNLDFFDGDNLLGKCFSGSCGKKFSSASYLHAIGVSHSEVMEVHGRDSEAAITNLTAKPQAFSMDEKIVEKTPEKIFEVKGFINVEDEPNTSAARYAVKRGYDISLRNLIKIDLETSAVVFLCIKNGQVVGYQKRFVRPIHIKTDTAEGFITGENVLHYPNSGDIVVCEGPFTAISAYRWGFDSFVTFGSGISKTHLEIIAEHAAKTGKRVLVARENDDAGNKYTDTIISFFSWRGVEVKVIEPEVGSDLNDAFVAGKGYKIGEFDFCQSLPNIASMF